MNLLSLEQFRQQIHYNPWHYWGWQNALAPVTSTCNSVVKKYAWQTQDAVGREEIRQAIETAENRLRDYLNYSVAPHYTNEIQDYPDFYDKALWARWPMGADGKWKAVLLKEGYVAGCGIEQLTLIGTPAVTYADIDGDGLKEAWQITIATTETDPLRLAVYFASADRINVYNAEPASENWRIQPVNISISGGVATITGKSWMLGRPILYEAYNAADLDPSVAGNFVSHLDVYQRICYADGTSVDNAEGKFIWETLPYPVSWCTFCPPSTNGETDPSAYAYSVARVGVHGDGKLGFVIPGEALLDATTGFWNMTLPPWSAGSGYGLCRAPDKLEVRYYAGYPLDNDGQMNRKFQTIVARLALAEMTSRISACDEANRAIYQWQKDRAQVMDRTDGYRISNADLDNPYGTRAGHIFAWHETKHLRLIRPVTTP